MQEEEFNICFNTSGLRLPPQGVHLVWNWKWKGYDSSSSGGTNIDHVSETSFEDDDPHHNPHMRSPSVESCTSPQTHTVRFKCVGGNYDVNAQETLSQVTKLLRRGIEVPVTIIPEPNNQFDSKAIYFLCKVNDTWHKIGYIVREALDDVHLACTSGRILEIKVAWAQYLVMWTRSGPGFYAGIDITVKGRWS